MPNTSDAAFSDQSRWAEHQRHLIASLRDHPLLVVLRPTQVDWSGKTFEQAPLFALVDQLVTAGVHHIEIAWVDHPSWPDLMAALRARHPTLALGAASVTTPEALQAVIDLDMAYAMSPCLDPQLLQLARQQGQLLVPGVFSPSELRQAVALGCALVKLFPAGSLGLDYLRQLSAPMAPLPCVIAAGGLQVDDLDPWLAAGCHAVALGRGVIDGNSLDPKLLNWLS